VFWPQRGTVRRTTQLLVLSFALSSCELFEEQASKTEAPTYPITVSVYGDARQPLAGVELFDQKTLLGKTAASGSVSLKLTGNEGSTVSLRVKCPATFKSPEKPVVVGLRLMSPGSPAPKFEAECVPLVRTVVVGLRAENGPNLNIVRLNQLVGRTDEHGVAHVRLLVSPGEQVALTLNTSASPLLRPQNPSLSFVAADRDEMLLLEHKFTVHKPVIHVKPRNIPKPL
jgi:hypothetical protein